MRLSTKLISFLVFVSPVISYAALPPAAESLRKLKAVAESPALYERLGSSDQVTGITVAKEGYLVTTNRCRIRASIKETNLNEIDPGLIGPPKLEVIIGEVKCHGSGSSSGKTKRSRKFETFN